LIETRRKENLERACKWIEQRRVQRQSRQLNGGHSKVVEAAAPADQSEVVIGQVRTPLH
jgi:hypothetical protein